VRFECDTPEEILPAVQDARIVWVDFMVEDMETEGEAIATKLGFQPNLTLTLLKGYYANYEDREVELGLMVPVVGVTKLEVNVNPLLILIKKGLIVTIHRGKSRRLMKFSRYANTFMRKIPSEASWHDVLTIVLIRILDENNNRNFDHLREIEDQADDLSKDLMDPKTPRTKVGPEIYNMKHALITYMNTLWATLDVLDSLRYGDAEVLTDDVGLLKRINLLADDVNRQLSLSEHMSEVLASGLEVLQTIYNNQLQMLNNRLAFLATWLAIAGTAVLVPNTLATIYGISAVSEHLSYSFVVWSLVMSIVISTVLVFLVIKWKEWMPRKLDL
jgi:magnesium transporter